MFSVAPNILLVPNMTQNAERKHRTQDANTAHNRLRANNFCDYIFGDRFRMLWTLGQLILLKEAISKQDFHSRFLHITHI